jgi:transposase InsO family protein
MKNDNLYWGLKKIQGELLKLGIHVDKKTIRNILNGYRRKGKVKQSLTWKQFLNVQAHSIYAMDFFTIDTILNQRYYVFFIIHHKSRVIAQFSITQNPCREFVRQQLIEFSDKLKNSAYIIHDNAAQFHLNFLPEKQIRGILTEYIEYYNALRPHQGIDQNIPQGYKPQYSKKVRKIPILGGICYHYESHAA